jgi:hypothetical protein
VNLEGEKTNFLFFLKKIHFGKMAKMGVKMGKRKKRRARKLKNFLW